MVTIGLECPSAKCGEFSSEHWVELTRHYCISCVIARKVHEKVVKQHSELVQR